jgi:hypothetical protein
MSRQSSGGPEWFDLRNYDLSGATLRDWLVELSNRKFCFSTLARARSEERFRKGRALREAQAVWQAVREVGSLTRLHRNFRSQFPTLHSSTANVDRSLQEDAELANGLAQVKRDSELLKQLAFRENWLPEQGEPNEQGIVVTRLTKGDVLMRFLLGGELDKLAEEVSETDSFPHGLLSPIPMDRIGRTQGVDGDFRFLKVDMSAPDAMIKKELVAWLVSERQRQASSGTITPRLVSIEDFSDWRKFAVLPYLDLMFAAEHEDFRLTQEGVGNLLFPSEDPAVSLAERIRKVTRPKALSIFSDSFIAGMRHQYEQECLSKRND